MGTLSIAQGPDGTKATVSLDTNNKTLTITPKAAGTTSVIVKEANGNKTATINISVLQTSITANPESVTVYVGGGAKTVTLGGTNAGAFSIVTGPNTTYATATLNDKTLTITPKAQGDTSVVVKEANGNVQKTIKITVKEVSLGVNPTISTVYLGGSSKTVQITGANYSALTVSSSDSNVATGSVSGTNLTIKPGSKAGTATITLKETNANKETKVTVTVRDSSIQASAAEVKAYVGGSAKTVTINGTYAGTLSVSTNTNSNVASASVDTNTKQLTISPKAVGTTTITVKEANAGKTTSVKVTVEQTSINGQDVTLFVGGSSKTITITGSSNMGTLSIEDGPDTAKAKASLNTNNKTLTITPVAAGETTVILKEANGNQKATINIEVLATSVTANPESVTAYVGGGNKTVTIGGDNKGTLRLSGINTNIATASISGNTLTITPKAEGTTSVTITESNGNAKVTVSIKVLTTTIKAEPTSVVAYVDGTAQTVNLSGDNAGAFSITSGGSTTYYTASITNSTLTITPKAQGSGNIVVKEANGGKTVAIPVTVKTVTLGVSTNSVTAYKGGSDQTVTITGSNYAGLTVTSDTPDIATGSISGTTLTIKPGTTTGTATLTLKETNANKQATVTVTVKASSITASSTSVTAYVGGGNKTVTISGSNMGTLSISTQPTSAVATASLSGSTLTITPKGSGTTNIVVREANGKKTVTIKVTVLATSITAQTVTVYAGGNAKTVTIQGSNMGALTIKTQPDKKYATASISGTSLTITPTDTAGTTSLVLQESNGKKTATINISVLATSITASPTSVTAYVGGGDQTVTLGGTNAGAFSIVTGPNSTYATASLSDKTLTISPKAQGETSVVVREGNGNKQIAIKITVNESYLGNYADTNGDGYADGFIFADLAVGGSGTWNNNSWTSYSYTKVSSGLKEYYIANENYSDSRFGNKSGKLIAPVEGTSGNDRFYIIALEDVTPGKSYCWYAAAKGKLDKIVSETANDFGSGKANTDYVMNKWTSSSWGNQNMDSLFKDMWGVVQEEINKKKNDKSTWFVASNSEWAAFGDMANIGLLQNSCESYGLTGWYWSSSQCSVDTVGSAYMGTRPNYGYRSGLFHSCASVCDFLIL